MNIYRSEKGFTLVEMIMACAIICILGSIYYFMVDSYKDRRNNEEAAKILIQAARAQEEYFAKEHRYFDAEVAGNGGDITLTTPGGTRTSVKVPSSVVLTLKAQGKDKREFVGHSFYTGSKIMHKYDSRTGKISTAGRVQDDAG